MHDSKFSVFGWENTELQALPADIVALQGWFVANFLQLYTPVLGLKVRSANIVSVAPFSMVLTIAAIEDSDTMGKNSYQLQDSVGNIFGLVH